MLSTYTQLSIDFSFALAASFLAFSRVFLVAFCSLLASLKMSFRLLDFGSFEIVLSRCITFWVMKPSYFISSFS